MLIFFGALGLGFGGDLRFVQQPGATAGEPGEREEDKHRNARQQGQDDHQPGTDREGLRIAAQLIEQGLVGAAGGAAFGNQQASRGGDNQRRDLADQTVTDRQNGVCRGGLVEVQIILRHADHNAANNIDDGDQQASDGVAAHEFGGPVHGSEKRVFEIQILPPRARLVLVDQAGGQVGVDGHLFARHGVQAEAGRNLGDPAGTLGDNDEIDDHQDRENNHPDDRVTAHHELTESLDHLTGGVGAGVAFGQNQARRRQVE